MSGEFSSRLCGGDGVYHLQLAVALDRCTDVELTVLNPCAARRFAQAHLVRAKTDAIDADGLLQYLQRMEFRRWSAQREELLQLQRITHDLAQLDKEARSERLTDIIIGWSIEVYDRVQQKELFRRCLK